MAASFAILTEAACDLDAQRLAALGVTAVPVPITVDGQAFQHYPDGRDISFQEFYAQLRKKAVIKTSAPAPEAFVALAEPLLEAGQDLLYLGLSPTLSGTFQSGEIALGLLRERFPERRIVGLDTCSGAMGEALLVEMAARCRDEGMSLEQTARTVADNRLRVAHFFTLDDLDYLRRSGRLTAYAAALGTILQIKPVLRLSAEGLFTVYARVRSYHKAVARLFEVVAERAFDLKNQVVYISHADVRETAEKLAQRIRLAGAKDTVITLLGPAIAAHFGVGGIGVAFLAEAR
ncbi:MAG: DegV family protein [Clostridiales bacterium]|nr:DegV family protein [Clostridiales bacterium]